MAGQSARAQRATKRAARAGDDDARRVRTRDADSPEDALLVRTHLGDLVHFQCELGEKRLVRRSSGDGQMWIEFEGLRGFERIVRLVHANNSVNHYDGPVGSERVVRMELSNGVVQHYDGARGAERKVRSELPNGDVFEYAGGGGHERIVRAVKVDGSVTWFAGPPGQERMVDHTYANATFHYRGSKGEEHTTWVTRPDGKTVPWGTHDDGEKARDALRALMDGLDDTKDCLSEGQYVHLADLAKRAWSATQTPSVSV